MSVQENISQIREQMAAACARAGREPDSVQLVAVSKMHGWESVIEAVECGQKVFGESRVQEAIAKIPRCPGGLSWHMIGHLQTNKVRQVVQYFDVIHSIDSLRLLEAVNQAAQQAGRTLKVLLEVNVSGESVKFGLKPEETPAVLEASNRLMNIELTGLMTMPPVSALAEGARPHFRRLCELRDEWRAATGIPLDELSMGMSHDFEVAIEEGATWIRVGTDIFGDRTK
ncbi:MAG: YggS family pyridoxal phosphate-dependent enzyme [Kiritimatiellia bacterium]